MKSCVLVIGSEGFIGGHLCKYLASSGYKLKGMDLLAANDTSIYDSYCQGNLLDLDSVITIVSEFKPNIIINLAARTDLVGSTLNDYAVNFNGINNLIIAIKKAGFVQRCIFTSTQLVHEISKASSESQDYSYDTLYGQSKALGEMKIQELNSGEVEWCITRPTTIWGPRMSLHYQRLFKLIKKGLYFHIGRKPLLKSYGYVENTTHQYQMLMEAPANKIHRRIFYLADYEPMSLQGWLNGIQVAIGAPGIPTISFSCARLLAFMGDILQTLGIKNFPFNSFRLKNILTEYIFDLSKTKEICGDIPYSCEYGIEKTSKWLIEDGIV